MLKLLILILSEKQQKWQHLLNHNSSLDWRCGDFSDSGCNAAIEDAKRQEHIWLRANEIRPGRFRNNGERDLC